MRLGVTWVGSLIVVSNVAIIAGAALFGWGPLAVVLLFVLDLVFSALRFTVERLFAARPYRRTKRITYWRHLYAAKVIVWAIHLLSFIGSFTAFTIIG